MQTSGSLCVVVMRCTSCEAFETGVHWPVKFWVGAMGHHLSKYRRLAEEEAYGRSPPL